MNLFEPIKCSRMLERKPCRAIYMHGYAVLAVNSGFGFHPGRHQLDIVGTMDLCPRGSCAIANSNDLAEIVLLSPSLRDPADWYQSPRLPRLSENRSVRAMDPGSAVLNAGSRPSRIGVMCPWLAGLVPKQHFGRLAADRQYHVGQPKATSR
jgi:hypothetical protein